MSIIGSSDFSPGTSPSINDGTLSSSHSGTEDPPRSADSLLSPTLLNNLTLPFTEMNLDNTQPMSVFRVRSHSVTERTVSPSETWCDPAARSGVRSAPSTIAPLPYDALADYTASSHVNECSFYQHGDGTFSPVNEVSPLTSIDGLYPGVCQVAGPEQTIYHNTGSGLLLQPDDIRSCPPLKPEMQSDPCISTHHRGHSDPSGYLSPTSPVDQRGDRMHHRRSGSVFKSRRHAPYPASAPSTPEGGFVLPELAEGHLTQRRYSGHSPSRPKLTVDVAQSFQGQQVMASPYQTPWRLDQAAESPHVLHVVKTEWDQANGISHPLSSPQLVHVMPGQPPMYVIDDQPSPSPSSAISSASPSPGYKDIVGSQKIVDASSARRKRDGKFKCDWPNCEQTFTAKHNLQCKCYVFSYPLMSVLMIFIVDHILSHNKVRPFQCGKCEDSFTTPGVANRHRAKCTGSEKNTRRRRSATSVAPPSAHASTSR